MRCLISGNGRLGEPPRLRRGRARADPRPQSALRRQRRAPGPDTHHCRLAGRDGERELRARADCNRILDLADQLDQHRRRDDLRVCSVAAALRRIGCAAHVYRRGLCLGLRQHLGRGHRFGRSVLLPGGRLSGGAAAGDRTHRVGGSAGGSRRRSGSSRWSSWSRATPGFSRPGPSRWASSSPPSPPA